MMALKHPLTKRTVGLRSLLLGMTAWPPGAADCAISGISLDSRTLTEGDLFIALQGHSRHGLEFAQSAARAGAAAILFEKSSSDPILEPELGIPCIGVEGLGEKIGPLAAQFFEYPSNDLFVIGITGTNGKTSTSHFIAQGWALDKNGPCALVGTLGNGLPGALMPTNHTTPDAVSLQRLLGAFRHAQYGAVAMEVSSHGLEQGRLNGVKFDVAVFTNLSRDHLDYHGDMERYGAAKARLFSIPSLRSAVLNLADPFSNKILAGLAPSAEVVGYSLGAPRILINRSHRQLRGRIIHAERRGVTLELSGDRGNAVLTTTLLGEFTAINLLAAAAALLQSGMQLDEIAARLSRVQGVPGRMEPFGAPGKALVFVDYAHTPDAMQHVLQSARKFCRGQLWCVFGCGGNRDRGKRPQMGLVAQTLADHVIVTDDNPRHERPEDIAQEIIVGMRAPHAATVIHDRAAAIAFAIDHAQPDDVVVVAGKGHEDYQEICGSRRPFSDREFVRHLVGSVDAPC